MTEIRSVHRVPEGHVVQASCLPYFDGDYIASEAEVIIKDLKAGKLTVDLPVEKEKEGEKEGEKDDEEGDKTKRAKAKARRPTRSAGVKLTDKGDRGPIMTKLASIIEPMKEPSWYAACIRRVRGRVRCPSRGGGRRGGEDCRGGAEESRSSEGGGVVGNVAVNIPRSLRARRKLKRLRRATTSRRARRA